MEPGTAERFPATTFWYPANSKESPLSSRCTCSTQYSRNRSACSCLGSGPQGNVSFETLKFDVVALDSESRPVGEFRGRRCLKQLRAWSQGYSPNH